MDSFPKQLRRDLLRFRYLAIAILLGALRFSPAYAQCAGCGSSPVDWTTLPSTYTHDAYGHRVDQFAQPLTSERNERPDFQRSAYRNTRSSLQVGTTADNYHVVEQWGTPVQPYGEWLYPFRPYSVPYDAWGPQYPPIGILGAVPSYYGGPTNGYPNSPGYPGHYGRHMSGNAPTNGYGPNGIAAPYSNVYPNAPIAPFAAGSGTGPLPGLPPVGVPGGGMPPQYPPPLNNYQAPWIDGYHQLAPVEPTLPDAQFFARPPR